MYRLSQATQAKNCRWDTTITKNSKNQVLQNIHLKSISLLYLAESAPSKILKARLAFLKTWNVGVFKRKFTNWFSELGPKKQELLEVIKRCLKSCSAMPLSEKIDLNPLTPYYWIQVSGTYLCFNFYDIKFWREINRCHKITKRRVANGTASKGLNLFSRIRGIAEHGFGRLFINSSILLISSYPAQKSS